ncbi:MAG: hypothetical protein ACI9J3_000014 [Parvicellaceae bacterium]
MWTIDWTVDIKSTDMKNSTLLIISSTLKSDFFWQHHLDIEHTQLINLEASENSFMAVSAITPDLCILDEYYAGNGILTKQFLEKVNLFQSDVPIYHLSPENSWAISRKVIPIGRIQRFVMSQEFINTTNRSINPDLMTKSVS